MLPATELSLPARFARLLIGSAVLGLGVALLLNSHLGTDGYSTLLQGTSIALDLRFVEVAVGLGALMAGIGWLRGLRPGWATVLQPPTTGIVVTLALPVVPEPDDLMLRSVQLVIGFFVLCLGIAAYLASDLGNGPAETLAKAFDPPFAFRWFYSVLQVGFAIIGWQLGADLGVGTVLSGIAIGPVVTQFSRLFR